MASVGGAAGMKGAADISGCLNDYLSIELTGHRQYLRNSRACAHWGFNRMAGIQWAYAIEEMEHAAKLADRILSTCSIALTALRAADAM